MTISYASGISTIPLAIAAAEVAQRAAGVDQAGAPLVLFDARRYLRPDGADVTGNFCAGLRLELADPGDPVSVDAAIKQAVALGRPLAVTAAAALTSAVRRRPVIDRAPVTPAWDVAYTHMGKPPELARVTRTGRRRASYVGLLPPSGPAGVTFAMSEIGDQLNVSVSFHDNVIDPVAVADVTDRLVTDPAGLLEAHRTADLLEIPS